MTANIETKVLTVVNSGLNKFVDEAKSILLMLLKFLPASYSDIGKILQDILILIEDLATALQKLS